MSDLKTLFDSIFTASASLATAPILALGVGLLLLLLCDIVTPLRPARGLAFVGTLVVAAILQARVLFANSAPGLVLDGTFLADPTTALFGLSFLVGSLLAWLYASGYYDEERVLATEHDVLFLAAPAGMILMVGAADLLVFFVGLELLSLPLYALAAFRRSRADSVEAGLKYFLLGAFSSAMFLFGSALLYTAAGSLSLSAIAEHGLASRTALAGIALVTSGVFFKASIFPFHMWVPDVYQGSPTPVTALMATGTKAAIFGFLVVQLMPLLPPSAAPMIAVLAIVTMFLGNFGALVQSNVKRMLAYSGVAHAGTLLLVVPGFLAGADPAAASRAALFYLIAYLFTGTGAFGLLALLEADGERFTSLDSLKGLAKRRPAIAAAMTLFLLSLGGIPATGGFLGKWFVFSVLVEAGWTGTAILGVLFSVVALGYYLRVIVAMYMEEALEGEAAPTTNRTGATAATAVCVVGVLATGLLPALLLGPLGS